MKNKILEEKRIYLDYAGSTPIDPRVLKVVTDSLDRDLGNPSSLFVEARESKQMIEKARTDIASILESKPQDIVFTASGTESINLAILGVVSDPAGKHFVTTTIEHPAVLQSFKDLERRGASISYVSPDSDGLINSNDISSLIKPETVLVSVMYANNEIGTVQPIRDISRVISKFNKENKCSILFHCDASQAVAWLPAGLERLGVDLLSVDGSKIYATKGIGLLAKRSSTKLNPIIFGGGQEGGLRSGTENLSAILGLSEALKIIVNERQLDSERVKNLSERLRIGIEKIRPDAKLNGHSEKRLPNNLSFCFPGLDSEFAVIKLDGAGLACSASSSCQSRGKNSSSYVIESIGNKDCSASSLRFTAGRFSSEEDIDRAIEIISTVL